MPARPKETETVQVAFRLPLALVARVDAYAKRLNDSTPGLEATRTGAVRTLLTQALDSLRVKGKDKAH